MCARRLVGPPYQPRLKQSQARDVPVRDFCGAGVGYPTPLTSITLASSALAGTTEPKGSGVEEAPPLASLHPLV